VSCAPLTRSGPPRLGHGRRSAERAAGAGGWRGGHCASTITLLPSWGYYPAGRGQAGSIALRGPKTLGSSGRRFYCAASRNLVEPGREAYSPPSSNKKLAGETTHIMNPCSTGGEGEIVCFLGRSSPQCLQWSEVVVGNNAGLPGVFLHGRPGLAMPRRTGTRGKGEGRISSAANRSWARLYASIPVDGLRRIFDPRLAEDPPSDG